MPHAASAARVVLPAWFVAAQNEIGVREAPGNRGPAIRRYIAAARCGSEGDPWCAIFANAMLESAASAARARRSRARSSAIRISCGSTARARLHRHLLARHEASGLGHVGFYAGERGGRIFTLGGTRATWCASSVSESRRALACPATSGRRAWPAATGALPPQLAATGAVTGKVT